MSLRDFVLHNLRWKLIALLLAMLVWFAIKFDIYRVSTGGRDQILSRRPVMVLKAPDDPRVFHIVPPQVDLIVTSAKEVDPEDLEIFVNLTGLPDVETAFRQVLVRGAEANQVVVVKPWGVTVERVSPSELSLTNALRKP